MLVSVVMPSYNHQRYVAEAMASVYAQTYRPIEFVIIDDGSTDGSYEVIRRVVAETPAPSGITARAHVRENRGAHATINEGVALARGRYVAIINSDDAYTPDRIERCVAAARQQGSRLVFTYVEPIDMEGRPLDEGHRWRRWYSEAQRLERDAVPGIGFVLLTHNIAVSTGNFVFRRDLFDEVGGFEDYRYVHDLDFLLKSVELEEPVLIRETLYRYRRHGANTINVPFEHVDAELKRVFDRYLRSIRARPPRNVKAPAFGDRSPSMDAAFGHARWLDTGM